MVHGDSALQLNRYSFNNITSSKAQHPSPHLCPSLTLSDSAAKPVGHVDPFRRGLRYEESYAMAIGSSSESFIHWFDDKLNIAGCSKCHVTDDI